MSEHAVVVFTGPTLSAEEGRDLLEATWLPPAAQGDVYAAARRRPWGIGIIDGYFERVPSVWHKEILWAMSRGIHVFGAASMGALRAAELTAYGMEGIGRVFEAYRDNEIEDDDEVAIAHAPAELGFHAVTEAMVNVRATLAAATAAGALDEHDASTLLRQVKGWHYSQRTWRAIDEFASRELDAGAATRLAAWLPEHRVDQKRDDAIAMLLHVDARRKSDPAPKQVRFTLQRTDAWEQVRAQVDDRQFDARRGADTELPDAALEELRILGPEFQRARDRALTRFLALDMAERLEIGRPGQPASPASERRTWMDGQDLSAAAVDRLLAEEDAIARVAEIARSVLPPYLRDGLRLEGRYAVLLARARDKQEVLAAAGLSRPREADAALEEGTIWDWYFGVHLGLPVPDDLALWAAEHDFLTVEHLHAAALRERCYLLLTAVPEPVSGTQSVDTGE